MQQKGICRMSSRLYGKYDDTLTSRADESLQHADSLPVEVCIPALLIRLLLRQSRSRSRWYDPLHSGPEMSAQQVNAINVRLT